MKTLKSLVIGALVAFLGVSALAQEPSYAPIETETISFARGEFFAPKFVRRAATSADANWTVWSEDEDLVKVAVSADEEKTGSSSAEGASYVGQYAKVRMTASLEKSGTTKVYLQNDADEVCYAFKVVCDVVNCVYVTLRHSDTEEAMSEASQSWYRVPTEWVKPSDAEKGYAFSSDEGIAEIKQENGAYWLHAPTDGRDGLTRVVFVKDQEKLLSGGKIWMFYVTVNSVEVEKFLTFKDESKKDSEATLNIRAHYLNNVTEDVISRVLFVGTGCAAHYTQLKSSIAGSINAICAKAEVEAYVMKTGYGADTPASLHTIFPRGSVVTEASLVQYGNDGQGLHPGATGTTAWNPDTTSAHSCLKEFYNLLYSIASRAETRYKYDYIVLEFDGTRLASPKGDWDIPSDQALVVAEWMNEYYEGRRDSDGSRVIWIVDDDERIHPQEKERGDGVDHYLRPFNAYNSDGTTSFNEINNDFFRGLLGLLNPWICVENKLFSLSGNDLTEALNAALGEKVSFTSYSTRECLVGETYAHTAYYDDPDELEKFLAEHIQATAYAAKITDNVETQGLAFVEGTFKLCGAYETNKVGNVDIANWTELKWEPQPEAGMAATGYGFAIPTNGAIHAEIGNVTREFWSWIAVDIKDADGTFRDGAKYDAALGKYVRDPNLNTNALDVTEGESAQVYFYDTARPDQGVRAEAWTLWDWSFDVRTIDLKAAGVSRPYDGTSTNATYAVDPADATVTVSYSADKGATWTEPEAYDAGKFTSVTNVKARFVATRATYLPATSTVDVVITPLTIYVKGVDTNKVYGASDPDPLPYEYDLGNVLAGEEKLVRDLLDESARAGAKFARAPGEDVSDDGYAITNDVPFDAGVNYTVAYVPSKMRIAKTDFNGYAVDGYVGIYDGQGHTIGFTVDPAVAAMSPYAKTRVQFRLGDDGEWTDFEDYSEDGDYELIPRFTNVVSGAKVWVNAKNGGNYYETNFFGYVTITQRWVTVSAVDTNKVYGALDPDPLPVRYDLASAEEIGEGEAVSNALATCGGTIAREEGEAVGAYPITNEVPYAVEIGGARNYGVKFADGWFTIGRAKMEVLGGQAVPAEKTYDGIGTNFTLTVVDSQTKAEIEPDRFVVRVRGAEGEWTDWAGDACVTVTPAQVFFDYIIEKDGYDSITNTADGQAWAWIHPVTIYVNGVDTNKVYGAGDPEPLPYAYDLSNVVAGEEELVKGLLDASARAGAKFARVPGENVNETTGYAITNDVPFNAGGNYAVAYNPAKMTIAKAAFGVTVTDYFDVYKGQDRGYTIGFTVDPAVAAKDPTAKTQVQFRLDGGEWTDFEDYSATGDYRLIPLFTNVVDHAKVWVNAKNGGNYYETNFFGYVTITQRVVTVTAPQGLEVATDAEDETIMSAIEDAVNVAGALSTEEAEAITFKTFCEPSHEAGQSDEVTFPTGDGYEENVEDQGNYLVVYVPGSIRFKDDTPRQDVLYPCGGCCRCLCLCCACTRTYVGSIYKPGEGLFGTVSLKMTKTCKEGLADITATVTPRDGSAPLTFKKDGVRICGCRENTCTTKCTTKSKCGYFDFNSYGGFGLTSYGYGTNERYYFGWGVCKCGCGGSCDDHDRCKYDCDWGKCGWGSGDRTCASWCGKHDWGFGKCDHDCHKYDFGYGRSECDFGKYDCSASKYCWDFGKCGATFARPSDSCTRKVIKNRKIDCRDTCIFSWGKYECSWGKTCCDWGKYDWGKCDKGKCDWGKYDCEKTHSRCVILCPLVIELEQTGLSRYAKSAHSLSVSIVGDSMTGFFDMAYAIDGGRDVFLAPGDPKTQVGLNYVGIYNGVFDVTGADGEYEGEAAFSLTVQKTGAALVKCTMPDGKDYVCTTKIHVGANGFCAVPVMLQHKSHDGSVRGLAFRVAFGPEPEVDLIRVLNVSTWTMTGGKTSKTTELGTVSLSRFGLADGGVEIGGAGKVVIGGKTSEEAAGKVHFRVPTVLGDGTVAEKYRTYFEKVVTRGSVSGKWNVSFQLKASVLEAIRKGLKSASAKFEGLSDSNARSVKMKIRREDQTPGMRYGFVSSTDLSKIGDERPAKWLIATGAVDMEFEAPKLEGATSQFFATRVDVIPEEEEK